MVSFVWIFLNKRVKRLECGLCEKTYAYNSTGATTPLLRHLTEAHVIDRKNYTKHSNSTIYSAIMHLASYLLTFFYLVKKLSIIIIGPQIYLVLVVFPWPPGALTVMMFGSSLCWFLRVRRFLKLTTTLFPDFSPTIVSKSVKTTLVSQVILSLR